MRSRSPPAGRCRDDRDDATIRYKVLVGQDSGRATATFDFEADRRSYVERIYEGKDHRTFHFDRKRGVVTRVDVARSYGSHMQSEGKGTLELTSVQELEPAKLRDLPRRDGSLFRPPTRHTSRSTARSRNPATRPGRC